MAATVTDRTRRRRSCGWLAGMIALLWLSVSPAYGQSASASLAGVVVDETGAVLPGADVIATNAATNLARESTTNPEGRFAFPSLAPGRYVLRAALSGFQTAEVRNINLNINSEQTIRIQLSLASVGAEVRVVARAERVSTSPAVSTVVDRTFVENLPLSGRSLQSLLELTPGMKLSVSPNVLSRRRLSSRPFRVEMGTTSSSEATPSGLAVTETVGSSKAVWAWSLTLVSSSAKAGETRVPSSKIPNSCEAAC